MYMYCLRCSGKTNEYNYLYCIFSDILFRAGELNYIAVGICSHSYNTHLLPGWEETSIAFHTDEGSIFHSSDNAIPLKKPCKKGDIIKVSIALNTQDRTKIFVNFFYNGQNIYQTQMVLPKKGLYGVIGLMSVGEKIRISQPVVSKQLEFDVVWEISTPHAITHHGNGILSYSGLGDFKESSIGTIRSKSKINPFGDISQRSLEVRIVDPGESRFIAIGVISESYPTNLFPGWKEPSIGYHADNGNLFCGEETATNRPCKANDVMKCTVESIDKSPKRVMITFYRNQTAIGQVPAWTPPNGFLFCVGMMSRSEKVHVFLPELSFPYEPSSQNVVYENFWEELTPNLVHRKDGVYEYVGNGSQDSVGSIRSKQPLVPYSKNSWFEVKILNAGKSCYIALGVCSKLYSSDLLLGWEDLSVGFHADNGLILQSPMGEKATSHPCQAGDVIRCTIETIDGSDKQGNISFHRNGMLVGTAAFWKPMNGYYAQIGCMSVGESIKVLSSSMSLPSLKPGLISRPSAVGRTVRPIDTTVWPTNMPENQSLTSVPISTQSQDVYVPPEHSPHYTGPHSQFHHHRLFYQNPFHSPEMHPRQRYPHPPPREGFHPALSSHGTLHHPYTGRFLGQRPQWPPLRFHSPAHDLSASYPAATRSPAQPTKQMSVQEPLSVTSPSEHLKRSITHPQDLKAQTNQEGVFYPSTDLRLPQFLTPETTQEQTNSHFTASHIHRDQNPAVSPLNDAQDRQLTKGYADKGPFDKKNPQSEKAEGIESTDIGHDAQPIQDYFEPITERFSSEYILPSMEKPRYDKEQTVSEDLTVGDKSKISVVASCNVSGSPTSLSKQSKSAVRPPLSSQVSVSSSAKVFTKSENKHFKILHKVSFESNSGPFENCLADGNTLENAFIVARLPLSEKNPYFEVEIQHIGPNGNVAVGLIWDNYPVFHLPGALEGSIAFHSITGSVQSGGAEVELNQQLTPYSYSQGDVIGCRALLKYKSEISSEDENSVKVEFYLNGCLISTTSLFLPPSGFFPAIGLKGFKSKLKYSQNTQLSPETYFETHSIPKDYRNFPSPPPLASGWECLKNAKIQSDNMLCLLKQKTGSPTVIQNRAPFSKTSPYFQFEVEHSLNSFSVLAIGATSSICPDVKKIIPGEAPDSVGYLPLLGFVMKSGSISSTIPDTITADIQSKKLKIGIGIDFEAHETNWDLSPVSNKLDFDTAPTSKRVKVFFTLNNQQICYIFTCLPQDGFFPCLAIDSDSIPLSDPVACVHFPTEWPPVNQQLPTGFVRAFQTWQLGRYDSSTFVDNRPALMDSSNLPVRALQAAEPLSPSHPYYEICIIKGGDTFKISCGLAAYNYPLNAHPGWQNDSIALHADDGKLFHNGTSQPLCPPLHYRGTVIGCGLRFPGIRQARYGEVYFTVNRKLVGTKLVKISHLGYYPTIGVRTNGAIVSVFISIPSPLSEIEKRFRTTWGDIQNMKVEGNNIHLASQSQPGAVIQATPLRIDEESYFTITSLTERTGRILIGFSTSKTSPLNFLRSNMEGIKAYAVDISTGMVLIYDRYFQTKESFGPQSGTNFGCGLLPQPSMGKVLLLFTVNDQAVSYTAIDDVSSEIYPFVIMMDSQTRLSVDMCALWPPVSPVGQGWARYSNVKLQECMITHTAVPGKKKFPVGFLQSSTPLTRFSPYFEINVCSRANDKAIAIGLSSKRYPLNSWVGWGPESIAYHLDDGKLFKCSNLGHGFGPKAFTGDTVGCGLRFGTSGITVKGEEKLEVFFTFNGGIIGAQKVSIPPGGLFPTICVESPSESVIFSQYEDFPPVSSMVCDSDWSNAYCVVQSGMLLQNTLRNSISTMPKGFCQAREPFTPSRNYFEILITGCKDQSHIQIGLCTLIAQGSTTPNTYGILYSMAGQIITRRSSRNGTQKYTSTAQKASIGDRLGCMIVFKERVALAVEFYLNHMKVSTLSFTDFWRPQNIFPTIVLIGPRDSVMPFLNIPKPIWDPNSLTGWLRSERVRVRGKIIEYIAAGRSDDDVGVAQVSQALQPSSRFSYFEIEVLDRGQKCTIAVGIAPADYPLQRQPGWNRDSIAYHGDDGRLFQDSGSGFAFGPSWKKNDVIGLGVRSPSLDTTVTSEVQVFFTRNGEEIGHTTHPVPLGGLFPTIGLHSPGEKVKVSVNNSINVPCNIEPKRSFWRSICGIHVTNSSENSQILTFKENERQISKLYVLISLAIAATPFSSSMQYFEVELLSTGTIGMAVGVAPTDYPLSRATGWAENSVAYHTDDGRLYAGSTTGSLFGPVCHKGEDDVIEFTIIMYISVCITYFRRYVH